MVTNYTTTVPGANSRLGTPSQRDLLLKRFAGEVHATYNVKNILAPYLYVREAKGTKSLQFPAIGKVNAQYHQPGEELTGQSVKHGERTITIDDLLVSDIFVSNFEEMINHFEVRSQYTTEMGIALANAYERKAFALAINACLQPDDPRFRPQIDEMDKPDRLYAGANFTPAQFIDQVFEAQTRLSEKNVPEMGRVLVVPPRIKNTLIQSGEILNRDYGNDNGSQAAGTLRQIAGLPVIESNNLRINNQGNVKREGVTVTDFNVDASGGNGADCNAVGLILQRGALGVAEVAGVSVESDYMVNRQGTLMVAKRANGMGLLRGEGLALIDGSDDPNA